MVRTKGDGGASRTVASKAPRKALGGGGSSSAASRAISAAAGAGSGRSAGFWLLSHALISSMIISKVKGGRP